MYDVSGPARAAVGATVVGTLNNCSSGDTPWGTYLTCEENWAGYFRNGDTANGEPNLPREQERYGVPTDQGRYAWELATGAPDEFVRFDLSVKGATPTDDYRNEANGFGWVVEIDPFDASATPVKRTALGRFAHEGVVFAPVVEGKPFVAYAGDDSRFEYIYKYVSKAPTKPTPVPDPGMPFSLVFRSEPGKEDITLDIASAYENASKRRVMPPSFGPIPLRS